MVKVRSIFDSMPTSKTNTETRIDITKYTKLQQSNITKNLKGLRNRVGSYTFKYANKKESDIYLEIKSILNK